MQDNDGTWASYRPSKTMWAWSLVGACAFTMVVGFTWGGWVLGGRAQVMTDNAVRQARAELVADVCVHNFVNAVDAEHNLEALKAKSTWERDDFIRDGGWTTVAGIDESVASAADACARKLMEMKALPQVEAAPVTGS
ncbi:hypothetical protein [Rhizobium sp. BK251]|uniref:hypothetical protein n=1 Tax=Rhizobium sp. BK251 TaxID=2512125 RepID=UPI0010535267|nr:hypothetical protein [Rhizobium sp. BK251]TCL63662.1 hypothetical protein EV286_11659 [Rhizobium sp. BK251]